MRIEFEGTEEEFRCLFGIEQPSGWSEPDKPEPASTEPKPKKKKKDEWVAEGMARIDALVGEGRQGVIKEALEQFGVKKLQELKVSDFPAFMERLNG